MHSLARGDFIVKYSKGEHSTGYRITLFSRLDLTHPFVPSLTHCLTSVLTHPLASYLSSLFPTPHTPPLCTSHCSLRVGSLLLMLIPARIIINSTLWGTLRFRNLHCPRVSLGKRPSFSLILSIPWGLKNVPPHVCIANSSCRLLLTFPLLLCWSNKLISLLPFPWPPSTAMT